MKLGSFDLRSPRGQLAVVLFIGLAAALLLAAITMRQFDGLYGQDPYAYYSYATGPLRESLLALQAPPPFFWPPGYPFLVALTTFLVGTRPLAGQMVSLIAALLVPLFTALLAREIWEGRKSEWPIALTAGLLAAFTGQLWQSSVVVMADTTGLAAATLGVWSLARYGRGRRTGAALSFGWLALAAASVSFAVLARWGYGLVAIPCTIYVFLVLGQTHLRQTGVEEQSGSRQPASRDQKGADLPTSRRPAGLSPGKIWTDIFGAQAGRRQWLTHSGGAALITLAILAPLWLPLAGGDSTGDAPGFFGDLAVYGWNPVHAFRSVHDSADGILRYRLPNGLYYVLAPAHRFYFTPLLVAFLIPGLWQLIQLRSLRAMVLVLGWAAMMVAFHAGNPWQNFRFTLAYLPPVAIMAAAGLDLIAGQLKPRLRPILVLILAAGLAWMAHGGWLLTRSFVDRKSTSLQTVRWVEDQLPEDGQLITFGETLTFQHYSQVETFEIFNLTTEQIAGLLEGDRPVFLFLELGVIEDQWRGRSPEINYRWLRDQVGLTLMAEHAVPDLFQNQVRTFSLFSVNE